MTPYKNQRYLIKIGIFLVLFSMIVVPVLAAHTVRFASSGLPNGISITVTGRKFDTFDNNVSYTSTFTSPGPGGDQITRRNRAFTYLFPVTVTSGSTIYNYVSGSPASPFTTGSDGGTTIVTATYAACTPPAITGQPSSTTKVFGQSVTFTVTASGTAPLSYQWKKDGTNISGATSATYSDASVLMTDAGAYTVVVSNSCGSVTSNAATLTVNQASTTTAVTSSDTSTVSGEPVTFTATVSAVAPGAGIPAGAVQFKDGGIDLGSPVALNATGRAVFSSSSLNVAPHTITVEYSGNASYIGSTSSPLTQTVSKASTTISVISSANPSVFGQPVTLTATVAAVAPGSGIPTGTVTFKDGATTLGTGTLTSGSTSTTASSLTVGSHPNITAVYNGDVNFNTKTSSALSQTVNKASTTTEVITSKTPTVLGEPVIFTATVAAVLPGAGIPSGTVQFRNGITNLSSPVTLDGSGTAISPGITSLNVGYHTITAVYSGSTSFLASTSPEVTQIVNKATSTSLIASSRNPTVFGQPVNFTATVSAVEPGTGVPTGSVQFWDGTTSLGSPVALNVSGKATISGITSLAAGSHSIKAQYSGDFNFTAPYIYTEFIQEVDQASTAVTVNSSKSPSLFGEPLTYTVTVHAVAPGSGIPTGSVQFMDNSMPIGLPVTLNTTGSGSLPGNTPTAGTHSITAVYYGDANFITATSAPVIQTVNPTSTTITVVSSPNPSIFGQPVALTATVNSSAAGILMPTGTVQFREGGTNLGSPVPLNSTGKATTPDISSLSVGSHSITAVYSGDSNFLTNSSTASSHIVNKSSTTVMVISSNNPAEDSQVISFTATILPIAPGAGIPTGTVQFRDNGTILGSPITLDGTGKVTIPNIVFDWTQLGVHPISAEYSGDSSFTANTSSALLQSIIIAPIPDLALIKVSPKSADGWLVANGSDSAPVELVVSRRGIPIPGMRASFSVNDSSIGGIAPVSQITDQEGSARSTFITTKKSGTVRINAWVNYTVNGSPYSIFNSTLQFIDHDTPYRVSSYDLKDEVTVGSNTSISVGLSDRWGNPIDNRRARDTESVTFTISSPSSRSPDMLSIPAAFWTGSTYLNNITRQLNSTGFVSVDLRVDTRAGANIIYIEPLMTTVPSMYKTIQGVADGIPWYFTQVIDPPSRSIPAHENWLFKINYTLLDRWGNGLRNHAIIWLSDLGDNETVFTNHEGWALRTYGPNTYEGDVIITAIADENRTLIQTAKLSFTNTSAVDMVLTANPRTMSRSDVFPYVPAEIDAKVIDVKGNPVKNQVVTFTIIPGTYPTAQVRAPSFSDTSIMNTKTATTNEYGIARVFFWSGSFETDSSKDYPEYDNQATGNCTVRAVWVGDTGLTKTQTVPLEWKNYLWLRVVTSASPASIPVNGTVDVTIKMIADGPALQPKPIDVILLLDDSGTMAGSRIHQAKEAAKTLVGQLNATRGDRMGVLYYNYDTYSLVPLTGDLSGVNTTIDTLSDTIPNGAHTRMRYAIYKAIQMVNQYGRTNAVKAVIHMTDGDWSMGGDPLARGNGFDIPFNVQDPKSIHSVWAGNVAPITDKYEYFDDLGGGTPDSGSVVVPNGQPYDSPYDTTSPWKDDDYQTTQNTTTKAFQHYFDGQSSKQNMSVYARDSRVKLYGLSFINEPQAITKAALANMANSSGAFYQHAPDQAALSALYLQIAGKLKEEASVNTVLGINLQNVEINGTDYGGNTVFDYVHSEKSTYVDNYYTNTSPITHISGYPINLDQSTMWSNSQTLSFNIGTIRLNQVWQANWTFKVKHEGNIDLFGPNAIITFNEDQQMKVPSVFITAAYNMTNISISMPILTIDDLEVKNVTIYQREWTWKRNFTGSGPLTERYYISVDNGRQWVQVGRLVIPEETAKTDKDGKYSVDLRTIENGVENSDQVLFRVDAVARGTGSPVRKQIGTSRAGEGQAFIKLE